MNRLCFAILLGAWTLAACGPDEGDKNNNVDKCQAGLLPGELVITEIMASPVGDSPAWFEIYNPSILAVNLEGVTLVASNADGTGELLHVMGPGTLGPRRYLAVGNVPAGAEPEYIGYGYGGDLTLPTASGRVAVKCDVVLVDEVVYESSEEAVARALSSELAPDDKDNDEPDNWCVARGEYAPGLLGTPGAANDCAPEPPPVMCDDNGTPRPMELPMPGDVVITEIMADPVAAGDNVGEWFELYVARDVDLNGLTVGRDPAGFADVILEDPSCLRATAGSYLVFARDPDPTVNGGLPRVDYPLATTLVNSNGSLFVGVGSTILDVVTWGATTGGASRNLDLNFIDAGTNDNALYWCASTDNVYGDGDKGTPGAANQGCEIIIPGYCDDNGTMRAVVPPAAGQVKITEYMSDPVVVGDATGEWFEVRFDADVDLNGLQLGKQPGAVLATVQSATCLRVTAGTYGVFARSSDPAMNSGLPRVDGTFSFGLTNSGDRLYVGIDGAELDAVEYTGSMAGQAASLDEAGGVWCPNAVDVYGAGDNKGTPGAANPICQ